MGAFRNGSGHTRTGRASTALLEGITVEYYGSQTPLNQLAGAVRSRAAPAGHPALRQDRVIDADRARASCSPISGSCRINDGKIIRVPIPELTEERRRDLVKHVRKVAEDYRVSVRNHRRDAIELLKELEKDKQITEDDLRTGQEKIQEITKDFIDRLDKILKAKEDEIMEV